MRKWWMLSPEDLVLHDQIISRHDFNISVLLSLMPHYDLLHAIATRFIDTIKSPFGWPGLCTEFKSYIQTCSECQLYMTVSKKKLRNLLCAQITRQISIQGHVCFDCSGYGQFTMDIDPIIKEHFQKSICLQHI